MKRNLVPTLARVAIFVLVCLVCFVLLVVVYGRLNFQKTTTYNAIFVNVTGLKLNDAVRIAGVEVGKVKNIKVLDDASVKVEFAADGAVVLTEGSRALIRYQNLVGGRYLALEEGPGATSHLKPGGTIPISQTQPALDVEALIGGFRPLFKALDPTAVNTLTGQLIQAFQGQGAVIGSFLNQVGALTNTLADRDQLIGEVIDNLNVVLGSLGEQSQQVDKAVDSLSALVNGLASRRGDVANAVGNLDSAAASIADLLTHARPAIQNTVHQADRTAGIIVADHDYVDNLLATLPEKYQTLSRLGLNGDYFAIYLCEIFLKVNGKGGQPVYIKMAGQSTGRCAPR
jgi:phospholipid/cholesterol/gamma-HCH transport system substrate-binding protein